MEICDIINETEDGPKDAIKAIRKRLQQAAGKNYTIVMYTLTVLETCVKNCGKKFHVLVCSKEFISELVKLIGNELFFMKNSVPGPKNEPPTAVQDKILSLIQSWADAFYQQSEMAGVMQVYQELRLKGIEFPMTDLDSMAPIHTPQKVCRGPTSDGRASPVAPVAAVGSVPPLSQEQSAKLYRELEIMQINMTVFGEMLNELTPGSEHPADWQLLQELNSTCKEMQERLVELVSKLPSDEVTAELLRINDLLNNLFLRYGRYENNREAGLNIKDGDSARTTAKTPASLIDLSDEVTPAQQITTQMAGLGLLSQLSVGIGGQLASLNTVDAQSGTLSPQKNEKEDSEFDMFAQSRNLTYESSKAGGSTYESNRKPDQVSGSLAAVAEARAQGTQNTAAATVCIL
ncbi:hypothetical protein AAG570_013743 [Ranatra chinensis]|uniref:TOM1-like protein 2 n=1 Tax=Ranatra chinensis TaxID=642074 RepID=A0ABD0YF01_9HEMI